MKRTTLTVLALLTLTALPAALVYAQGAIPPVYDSTGAMLTAIAPQPTANPRAYPWVYDATGAMQASVAPQPERLGAAPVLPADLVEASRIARLEAQADEAAQAEINRIYGHVELPADSSAASSDALTSANLSERLEARRDATTVGAIPPVYDATGAMLAAVESQAVVNDNGRIDLIEQADIERAMSMPQAAATSVTGPDAALNLESGVPLIYDATGAIEAAVVQSSEANAQAVATPATATARTDPSMYLVIGLGLLAAATLIGAWSLSHRTPQRHGPRHV